MARNHSERRRGQNHTPVKHGSLFSGIGGFDLAAEWMGWENLFNCEWEEFPRKVLKHHFPNAKQYGDIREFNAATYAGRIDILTGGFPCQPYSTAGKRKGKEDERHLWPEMLRIVRECSPRWVVGENVRGLVNWNGGLVFEEVCADLEAHGYSVQPFILPAAAVNAPHRRDRVWFVAHSNQRNDGRTAGKNAGESGEERIQERNSIRKPQEPNPIRQLSTDTHDQLCEQWHDDGKTERATEPKVRIKSPYRSGNEEWNASNSSSGGRSQNHLKHATEEYKLPRTSWEWFPTQSPLCGRDDGLSKELDGITFPKWRRESIKAYGNAIVPQVALRIFEAIQEYEKRT